MLAIPYRGMTITNLGQVKHSAFNSWHEQEKFF